MKVQEHYKKNFLNNFSNAFLGHLRCAFFHTLTSLYHQIFVNSYCLVLIFWKKVYLVTVLYYYYCSYVLYHGFRATYKCSIFSNLLQNWSSSIHPCQYRWPGWKDKESIGQKQKGGKHFFFIFRQLPGPSKELKFMSLMEFLMCNPTIPLKLKTDN